MTRKRWEYMAIDCQDTDSHENTFGWNVIEALNEAGADGWEAVAVGANAKSTHQILMKREMATGGGE